MPEKGPNFEQKPSAEQISREILEQAGQRNLEESTELLEDSLARLRKERLKSEGAISDAKTIDDIDRTRGKKFSEGAVTFVSIEDDAVIINASDIHGSSEDFTKAVEEFVRRKEAGENVYFNFSGDIGSGSPRKIECNEILAELAIKYPDAVTRESGNGDRRGASLIHGLATEMTEKFAPELFKALDKKVSEILLRYAEEQGIEKAEMEEKIANRGWEYNSVFGAQLLKAARMGGLKALKPEEINPVFLQKTVRGALRLKEGEVSMVLTANILSPFGRAMEAPSKTKKREKMFSDKLHGQAVNVFEYWRLQNEIYNEQPTYVIYENQTNLTIASHSGYVENIDKFGEVVYDPVKQGKGVWNRFGEKRGRVKIFKYGDFIDYNPEDYGKFWGKFVPRDKKITLIVGHNHGNSSEKIDLLGSESKSTGQTAQRIEVCSGEPKNKKPKYLVLDLKNNSSEFKDTK